MAEAVFSTGAPPTAGAPSFGAPAVGAPSGSDGPWCDRCGRPFDQAEHTSCLRARELEPPRYCARCRRRMVVQVTPAGWTARCVEHGELTSSA